MSENYMKITVDSEGHRKLTSPGGFYLGMEGENALNQVKIRFSAALENPTLYNAYTYYLDILYADNVAGALALTNSNGWLTATLTSAYLKRGMAICQIRAVNQTSSTTVWKTTCAEVPILASINSASALS